MKHSKYKKSSQMSDVRTYTVKDLRVGLEQIKRELGSDARILNTRQIQGDDDQSLVEIVVQVASAPPASSDDTSQINKKGANDQNSDREIAQGAASELIAAVEPLIMQLAEQNKAQQEQMLEIQSELRHLRLKQEWTQSLSEQSTTQTTSPNATVLPTHISSAIQQGLVKLQLGGEFAATVALLHRQLTDSGILPADIEELIAYAFGDQSNWEQNPKLLFQLVEKQIAKYIDTTAPFWLKQSRTCEVAVLVGPTGIGKTTTLAKIAAQCAVVGRMKVAVICADTFRIGGVYQLESYAELIGLPMATATTIRDLAHALEEFKDFDLVLIDTTGHNPWSEANANAIRYEDYRKLPDHHNIQFHLCLSATTRTEDLVTMVERYRIIEPSSLIFTKVDEAQSLGCILSTCKAADLPVSHVCHGQAVPEDIDSPTSTELARWICEGKARTRTALDTTLLRK